MRRAAASTFFWKSGAALRSTGTEKKARFPRKYSESSSPARPARRAPPRERGPPHPPRPDQGHPPGCGREGGGVRDPPRRPRGAPPHLQYPPRQMPRVRRGREVSHEDLVHAVSLHATPPFVS